MIMKFLAELNGRRLSIVEKALVDFKDVQYYSELFIGSERKRMTFIYDTGSSVRIIAHPCIDK